VSAFAAIFSREFRLRRVLLIGALAIGLMSLAIPRLQGQTGAIAAETANAAALLIGFLTCSIYALILGSGAIARDLADGRLGFDFVRPISGLTLWAGRIGAALTLLSASALLVVGPALLTDPKGGGGPVWAPAAGWLPVLNMTGAFVVGLLSCWVLFFLTHLATVLFASRSALLGLDLAGLLAVGLLAGSALERLHRNWAMDAFGVGAASFFAFLLLALTGASLVQVLFGRTDLVRSHRALSMALWVPLLLGAFALDAASRWVVSPGLSDLVRTESVSKAPAGTWFGVGGDLRGRGALAGQFLVDAATGRVVRQGVSISNLTIKTDFSNDGKSVAWLALTPRGTEVRWVDLSAPEPRVETAPISFEGVAEEPSLSPTGRWLALRSDRRMLIFELRTGRLVASVPVTADWDALRTRWIAEDRLRFWSAEGNVSLGGEPRISIAETHVPQGPGSGAPASVGTIELTARGYAWYVNLDGGTVIVRELKTGRRRLFDGRTGAELGVIDAPQQQSGAILLADGSVAVLVQGPKSRGLAIYDRTGVLRRSFDLRSAKGLLFGAQPTPTTILVSVAAEATPLVRTARRLILLDLATGGIREVGRGWIAAFEALDSGVTVVRTGPATFARWDPATEMLKPIVPR